jgi:hypothetical protein
MFTSFPAHSYGDGIQLINLDNVISIVKLGDKESTIHFGGGRSTTVYVPFEEMGKYICPKEKFRRCKVRRNK